MQIVGRCLSDEERVRVEAPFAKNSGEKWDVQTVAHYVNAGADALEKDAKAREEIDKGMRELGGKGAI